MANIKNGFSFYRVDTDRYMDIRIKRLKKNFGCQGIAVYDYILCEIYRVRGCYIEWDESTAFDVAEYFAIKETTVTEIVKYCTSVGLFNKALHSRGILTSESIQRRYLAMSVSAKRKGATIPNEYLLIPKEESIQKTEELASPVTNYIVGKQQPSGQKPSISYDIHNLAALVPEDDYWEAMRLSSWGAANNIATQSILQWMQMDRQGKADKFYFVIQALQKLEDTGQLQTSNPNRLLWRAKVIIHKSQGIFSVHQSKELFAIADQKPEAFIAAVNEWQKNKGKINSPYNFIKSKL